MQALQGAGGLVDLLGQLAPLLHALAHLAQDSLEAALAGGQLGADAFMLLIQPMGELAQGLLLVGGQAAGQALGGLGHALAGLGQAVGVPSQLAQLRGRIKAAGQHLPLGRQQAGHALQIEQGPLVDQLCGWAGGDGPVEGGPQAGPRRGGGHLAQAHLAHLAGLGVGLLPSGDEPPELLHLRQVQELAGQVPHRGLQLLVQGPHPGPGRAQHRGGPVGLHRPASQADEHHHVQEVGRRVAAGGESHGRRAVDQAELLRRRRGRGPATGLQGLVQAHQVEIGEVHDHALQLHLAGVEGGPAGLAGGRRGAALVQSRAADGQGRGQSQHRPKTAPRH